MAKISKGQFEVLLGNDECKKHQDEGCMLHDCHECEMLSKLAMIGIYVDNYDGKYNWHHAYR